MTWIVLLLAAQDVGIEQRMGATVSLDLPFRDATGRDLRLGELFGRRPVILAFVYYRCPALCGQVVDGLYRALKTLPLEEGKDYEVVAVSVDPREGPELAAGRRRGKGHFLTGDARRLADEAGFRYRVDARTGEIAHAAGIMVLTPDGRLSRYFYGLEFPARDLRLGLVEASEGRIGSLADRLTLLCLRYDPATGRYSLAVLAAVRIGGGLGAAVLAAAVILMLRRERRRRADDAGR